MNITNYTFDEIINKYNIEDDKELFVKIMNGNFNNNYTTDSNILFNIENYYNYIKKDKIMMIKYYMMAIKYNNNAMYNLGYYYYFEKDYNMMKKYYMMAINNRKDMRYLAFYYFQIEKNYDMMNKYYIMSELI